ncbi:hypothetical protein TGMAS_289090 [Toxoplasma gondii MAS]|uniref:Uncharacterized protein n=2 Tax=Toxoplasma gondii TaxID=5811 RepID=A0A086QHD3_TOXGO|nr:hypothetical protein TGMAS_289090 [Toxoplasma gondii MAS]PUA90120.1 hypothetical protein TGBR9_289090 [Toxoplasma gondii TgCATBr9]
MSLFAVACAQHEDSPVFFSLFLCSSQCYSPFNSQHECYSSGHLGILIACFRATQRDSVFCEFHLPAPLPVHENEPDSQLCNLKIPHSFLVIYPVFLFSVSRQFATTHQCALSATRCDFLVARSCWSRSVLTEEGTANFLDWNAVVHSYRENTYTGFQSGSL